MHGPLHIAFITLLNILMIVLSVWLFAHILRGAGERRSAPDDDALDILKRRYARGEIDQDEYDEMKKNLVN